MPNSILWIGLVVLWVFVLFPILADRHPRIRQTTDAALATRVLHRGGSTRRTKSGPATGHDSDPNYGPTRVQRNLHHSDDAEDRMTTSADEADDETIRGDPMGHDRTAAYLDDAEPDEIDRGAVDSDHARGMAADDAAWDDADSGEFGGATADIAACTRDSVDDDDVAEDQTVVAETRRDKVSPAGSAAPARVTDADADIESAMDENEFVPARRGRGGFDPEADAIARAARYTFRQRAVLALVLGSIVFGALGIAIVPTFWWGCGPTALVLVTYLAYLRKQVRMEEEIRRSRSARLTRAQQYGADRANQPRRPANQHPGGMDRDTARALRRRSTSVDPDDEDPIFEHLETFDPATARALRSRAGSMRRAAGE